MEICKEVEQRHQEEEREWQLRIERAQYEAQRAYRQYNAVEPENRLVVRTLERNWESTLEELERLKEEHQLWQKQNRSPVSESERERLLEMMSDFRQVWKSPTTSQEDRKALVRLLIKDVTLSRDAKEIKINIRWQSGKLETLRTGNGNTPNITMLPAVIERIRALSDDHVDAEIAEILNKEGFVSARNKKFTKLSVSAIRHKHEIKKGHVGEAGVYTVRELASRIGVSDGTIVKWCEGGILRGKHQGKHCTYWIRASEEEIQRLVRDRGRRSR